jgi:hypothetical protein
MLDGERDEILGAALRRLATPAHGEGFMDVLQAGIAAERPPASAEPAFGRTARRSVVWRLFGNRRSRWLAGFGIAVVGGLTAGMLLLTGSTSDTTAMSRQDLAAVGRLAVAYSNAKSIAVVVPQDALADVMRRQAEVVASGAGPVQDGQPHTAVLSAAAKREIDAAYRAAMSKVLTPAFVVRTVDRPAAAGDDAGTMLDEGLYNNPKQAPLIREQTALAGYLKCKGQIGKDYVVWVQWWVEDVTAAGPRIEAWPVYELRVTSTPAGWLIAEARVIWVCLDTDHSTWGPTSPHESLSSGEHGAPSAFLGAQVTASDF